MGISCRCVDHGQPGTMLSSVQMPAATPELEGTMPHRPSYNLQDGATTVHLAFRGKGNPVPFTDEKKQQLAQALLAALNLDPSLGYSASNIELSLVHTGTVTGRRLHVSFTTGPANVRTAPPVDGLPTGAHPPTHRACPAPAAPGTCRQSETY